MRILQNGPVTRAVEKDNGAGMVNERLTRRRAHCGAMQSGSPFRTLSTRVPILGISGAVPYYRLNNGHRGQADFLTAFQSGERRMNATDRCGNFRRRHIVVPDRRGCRSIM